MISTSLVLYRMLQAVGVVEPEVMSCKSKYCLTSLQLQQMSLCIDCLLRVALVSSSAVHHMALL